MKRLAKKAVDDGDKVVVSKSMIERNKHSKFLRWSKLLYVCTCQVSMLEMHETLGSLSSTYAKR